MQGYTDRRHAGQALAERLLDLADRSDVVVLGLPRGGVPVAFEVAARLGAPLDVFIVRKLGVPGHEELAMGAMASGGTTVVNEQLVAALGVSPEDLREAVERETRELDRRELEYHGGRARPAIEGKTVIIVDDGLATGSTMRAAVMALREQAPARIIVAVPVGAPSTCDELATLADEVVCGLEPRSFTAVGQWYHNFTQTTDDEVRELLAARDAGADSPKTAETRAITAPAGSVRLAGDLATPPQPRGVVLFAHGSGSGRHSPRNKEVAGVLQQAGLVTFLVDLLTPDEEAVDVRTRELRFDIDLLADRLVALATWLAAQPATSSLPLGLFGASTGGGAALVAAARRPDLISAVVSRGGRPDLAGAALSEVRTPCLLIVGGEDDLVLQWNRAAKAKMKAHTELAVVPGAGHLFEEAGSLETVARLAREWFDVHLGQARQQAARR